MELIILLYIIFVILGYRKKKKILLIGFYFEIVFKVYKLFFKIRG